LNALLGDKFAEISLRRTTAAVNHFRIPSNNVTDKSVEPEQKKRRKDVVENVESWTAEATHAVIAKDNKNLRSIDDDIVVEKIFDIHMEDRICDMRKDTQLVLVDIPGINEADSSKKYKDYVQDKWNTFDCVIVVMDAVQGVNTMEQVELLKFVASNNEHLKHVPTIILGNKVDDPEDSEKMALVKETRTKCEEIFGQTCSELALVELTDVVKRCAYVKKNTDGAIFIPISAMNAYIYRKAAHLTPETFHRFDKDLMDKIGRDEVGRQWKSFSTEKKVKTIHNAISDIKAYEERLADTNF
jgi:signal recognition particle receptor subunit beta